MSNKLTPPTQEMLSWWNSLNEDWKKVFSFNITKDENSSLKENEIYDLFQLEHLIINDLPTEETPNLSLFKNLNFLEIEWSIKLTGMQMFNAYLGEPDQSMYFPTNAISNLIVGSENIEQIESLTLNCVPLMNIEQLPKLKNLKKLTINAHSIYEEDIVTLGELESVIELKIDASFSEIDIEPISKMKSLQKLDINANNINNINSLRHLTKLNYLHIKSLDDSNKINTDFLDYLDTENIKHLGISNFRLSYLTQLGKLKNIEYLDISSCAIRDLSFISNLGKLKHLNIRGNDIKHISELSHLKNLTYLDMTSNDIEDIKSLHTLKNLEYLNIEYNKIRSIEPLSKLKNLKKLNISSNYKLEDISPLRELINIESLRMEYNNISVLSPIENLVKIKELDISNNPIDSIKPIQNLSNLEYLGKDNRKEYSDEYVLEKFLNLK